MAYHDVLFPLDVAAAWEGGPRWRTDIVTGRSGVEKRNSPWAHGRRRYRVSVPQGRHVEREALIAFFHGRRGPLYSFRIRDWSDYKSGVANVSVAADDQTLGTGDGSDTTFQLVKLYDASGAEPYTRNITKPRNGTVLVAVDGVTKTEGTDYTIDYTTGIVTFTTAPGSGLSVTAGFQFDVPVRFEDEELPATFTVGDIEGSDERLVEYADIMLIEVRE